MSRLGLRLIAIILAGALSAVAQHSRKPLNPTPPGTTTITSFDKNHTVVGWLEVVPFESKIYHGTCTLRILSPANYFSPYNAHRSYPVLYMQGGQSLFDKANTGDEWRLDETVEHLVGSFKIPPMFVIGVDAPGPRPASAEAAHEYARFLITEVVPFVRKYYRLSHGAMNIGLGGGGYASNVALYTALEHPGVFGHLLLESPVDDGQLVKDVQHAKLLPHNIYIGVGSKESGDAVKGAQDLQSALQKKGMSAAHLKLVVQQGGEANEEAWASRLPEALVFLYGEEEK